VCAEDGEVKGTRIEEVSALVSVVSWYLCSRSPPSSHLHQLNRVIPPTVSSRSSHRLLLDDEALPPPTYPVF
jgi:hypothetical protein